MRSNRQNRFILFRFTITTQMALQRAQKQNFCLSTLSNSLRLEVNSPFRITKCAEIIRKKKFNNHTGVEFQSFPILSVHPGMTSLSPRLQRESSLRADKRDQSFSHYFHPFSAASPLVGSRGGVFTISTGSLRLPNQWYHQLLELKDQMANFV